MVIENIVAFLSFHLFPGPLEYTAIRVPFCHESVSRHEACLHLHQGGGPCLLLMVCGSSGWGWGSRLVLSSKLDDGAGSPASGDGLDESGSTTCGHESGDGVNGVSAGGLAPCPPVACSAPISSADGGGVGCGAGRGGSLISAACSRRALRVALY